MSKNTKILFGLALLLSLTAALLYLNFIRQAFSSTIGLILAILGYMIIPVYIFYLLADLPWLKTFLKSFIPERFRSGYDEKLAEVDRVLADWMLLAVPVAAIMRVFLRSLASYFRESEFYRGSS